MIERDETASITNWQIFMLFLSIYILLAVLIETIIKLPDETSFLLAWIDNAICIIFIGDFFFNLATAKSRLQYLKWGWIDLVSSIPNIQILRWGRIFRVVRILRILRGIRSIKRIFQFLVVSRARGTLAFVAIFSSALVIFSSIVILNCEPSTESNIKTASDALWWAFSTITTVGYGDRFPITTAGRIIAITLMIAGVSLFSTFTAYVASAFLGQKLTEEEVREKGCPPDY